MLCTGGQRTPWRDLSARPTSDFMTLHSDLSLQGNTSERYLEDKAVAGKSFQGSVRVARGS